jgi:hypothetical protein
MEGHHSSLREADADRNPAGRLLRGVLEEAYRGCFTVKSDFARSNAELVACAASLALITTQTSPVSFGRDWRVTAKGLRWLNEMKEMD